MTVSLPASIATYFDALRHGGFERLGTCFTPGAIMHDEGEFHCGPEAIAAWLRATQEKASYRVELLDALRDGDRVTVATKVVGNFPGRPVQLDQVFLLTDGLIQSLEIS